MLSSTTFPENKEQSESVTFALYS